MKKENKKILVILIPLVILISALSGCIAPNAIQTKGWDHVDNQGTEVRLWGFLVLGQNFKNWDGYFVYDTEFHDDWQHYEHKVEADSYTGLNTFSVVIDGLDRATEYHYRAVGENKQPGAEVRFGVDHTFIPGGPRVLVYVPSAIGIDSAVLEGELTHLGGAPSCQVYFRYGTDPDNMNQETTKQTMTSTGKYNFEVTGLTSCETYYYKAVATNDVDTWDSIFTLNFQAGTPIVETYFPNDITTTTAKFRGKLFNLGGTSDCQVWFEYGDQNPQQLDQTTDAITLTTTGEFDIDEEGLEPDTVYYTRAVANNGVCEHRGEIKEFRTLGFDQDTNEEPVENQNVERYPVLKSLISRLIKRYNIDEETLSIIMERYPLFNRILARI
jgi:hypothetical protein